MFISGRIFAYNDLIDDILEILNWLKMFFDRSKLDLYLIDWLGKKQRAIQMRLV